jgi:hypothetical protein
MLCYDCSHGKIYCGSCDEKEYEKHRKYIEKISKPLKTYEVIIPAYLFGRELERRYQARSAGEAKYLYWLDFADAYGDMKFGEFVTKVKCRIAS